MALHPPARVALVAPCLERADRLRLAAADAPLRRGGLGGAIVAFVIVMLVIVAFVIAMYVTVMFVIVAFAIVTFAIVNAVVVNADAELELCGDEAVELAVDGAADDRFDPSVQGLELAADPSP